MIKRLPYCEIDFEKYAACLRKSAFYAAYLEKEQLSFLCDWELLVYGDYDYCMPVPLKKKFGVKIVIMPLFCPQLGIFGTDTDISVNEKFLAYLNKNYPVHTYFFNHTNRFRTVLPKRKTHILTPQSREIRLKNYYKGRRAIVKKHTEIELKPLMLQEDFLIFVAKNIKGLEKESDKIFFINFLEFLERQKVLWLEGAYLHGELLSAAAIIKGRKVYHLLALINNETQVSQNAASHLMDAVLEQSTGIHFDFMGGNMENIGKFFRSFGATPYEFPCVRSSLGKLALDIVLK